MANIIDSLLGGVSSSPGAFLDTYMNATAKPQNIAPPPPEPTPQPQPQAPQHTEVKGPFGSHGALADILGYIGDAALASAGLQPEYQKKKMAAREGDAIAGFDQDPISAIHRLATINPDKARDLYNDMVQNNQRAAATGASQASAEAEQVRATAAKQLSDLKTFGAAGALLRTANPKNYSVMKDRVSQFLSSRGVEAPIPMPDKYDPDEINAWANGGVDTDKQVDNERQADVVDETRRHHSVAEGLQAKSVDISASNSSENARHNSVSEGIAAKNSDTSQANSVSQADYRNWLKANPSKSRGGFSGMGGGSVPPVPPASAKGKTATKNGVTWKSDGKQWMKVS